MSFLRRCAICLFSLDYYIELYSYESALGGCTAHLSMQTFSRTQPLWQDFIWLHPGLVCSLSGRQSSGSAFAVIAYLSILQSFHPVSKLLPNLQQDGPHSKADSNTVTIRCYGNSSTTSEASGALGGAFSSSPTGGCAQLYEPRESSIMVPCYASTMRDVVNIGYHHAYDHEIIHSTQP